MTATVPDAGRPPIFFSVIVPVWNRADDIGACLEALRQQTYPAERIEIIVVDNGSSDATAAVVAACPGVTLLHEPAPGSYHARNRGIAASRGAYLAFTDSDCRPAPDWLERAAQAIADQPGVALFGGRIAFFAKPSDGAICRLHELSFGMRQDSVMRLGGCLTANWVSPAALIRQHGPFDGRLKSSGDVALAQCMAAAGLPARYVPEMVVRHPVRGCLAELIGKRRRLAGGFRQTAGGWPWRRTRFLLGRCCRMPIRLLCGREAGHVPLADRVRLAGLVVLLDLVEVLEMIALALGGTPRRQ